MKNFYKGLIGFGLFVVIVLLASFGFFGVFQEEAYPSTMHSIVGVGCTPARTGVCMNLQGNRYYCDGSSGWDLMNCPEGMEFAGGDCGNCVVSSGVDTCSHSSPSCPSGETCNFASQVCVRQPSECYGIVVSSCMCGNYGLIHSGYCKRGVFSATAPTPIVPIVPSVPSVPVPEPSVPRVCEEGVCKQIGGVRHICNGFSWIMGECPVGREVGSDPCVCDVVMSEFTVCDSNADCDEGMSCLFSSGVCIDDPVECGNRLVSSDDVDSPCLCGVFVINSGYCLDEHLVDEDSNIVDDTDLADYRNTGSPYSACLISCGSYKYGEDTLFRKVSSHDSSVTACRELCANDFVVVDGCGWWQDYYETSVCDAKCKFFKGLSFGFYDTTETISGCKTALWVWLSGIGVFVLISGIGVFVLIFTAIIVSGRKKGRR